MRNEWAHGLWHSPQANFVQAGVFPARIGTTQSAMVALEGEADAIRLKFSGDFLVFKFIAYFAECLLLAVPNDLKG